MCPCDYSTTRCCDYIYVWLRAYVCIGLRPPAQYHTLLSLGGQSQPSPQRMLIQYSIGLRLDRISSRSVYLSSYSQNPTLDYSRTRTLPGRNLTKPTCISLILTLSLTWTQKKTLTLILTLSRTSTVQKYI